MIRGSSELSESNDTVDHLIAGVCACVEAHLIRAGAQALTELLRTPGTVVSITVHALVTKNMNEKSELYALSLCSKLYYPFCFPNNLVCIEERGTLIICYSIMNYPCTPTGKLSRKPAWLQWPQRMVSYLCTFRILFWGSVQQDVAFAGDI